MHKCASPCNTCFPARADPSPQLKRHFDQFSRFSTAHGRVSSGMPGHDTSLKIAPCMRQSRSHLICGSLSPTMPTAQMASPWVQPLFVQLTAEHPCTLQQADLSPIKIAPSHWGSGPPSNTISWVHTRPQSKQHLDRFSRLCTAHGIVSPYFTMWSACDRQTDHTARSVTIGHIYVCSTAMQHKKLKRNTPVKQLTFSN